MYYLIFSRHHHSLILTDVAVGTEMEIGKLKLFDIISDDNQTNKESLMLNVFVDGSIIEVYA